MTDERNWWPEGYDLPAFRVRRVTYGDTIGGDYVRGSSALTLPHTALRYPTKSISLDSISPAMRGRLFVQASYFEEGDLYNTMSIDWNWPAALEDTFQEVAIVRSAYGAPAWPEQGQTVFRAMRSFFPTDEDGTLLAPQTIYDQDLTPGHWYYYTAFFRTNPIDWTAIMSDSAVLPGEYRHKDHLWDSIPPYYQFTDENQGRTFLSNFLGILGYELDRTRQMVESVLDLHRIDAVPMQLLKGLGANYGYKYEAGLGDVLYRGLMANISRLLTKRSTEVALLGICETVSKYDCDTTPGINSVLTADTSNFVDSIGQWKPAHPLLNYTAPAIADYLPWNKVRLSVGRSIPSPGLVAPGAIGSMFIDSATTDTDDIFITAGAGLAVSEVGEDTTYGDDVKESIPLHDGIPVRPGNVYGMDLFIKMAVPSEVFLYFLPFDRLGKITGGLTPIPGLPHLPPDSDWYQVAMVGEIPPGAVYLVPAIYLRDRPMTGGVGGRTPEIAVAAVMVYRIISEVPVTVVAPDRYLVLGVEHMLIGETTTDDGMGEPYEGFVIGAPVTGAPPSGAAG